MVNLCIITLFIQNTSTGILNNITLLHYDNKFHDITLQDIRRESPE